MVPMYVRGRQLDFNSMGCMADFWAWDEEVAQGLAAEEGLQLHGSHWTVIRFLREFYSRHLIPLPSRAMYRALSIRLEHQGVCTAAAVHGLFPGGGCRQACRIAGLPDYFCESI